MTEYLQQRIEALEKANERLETALSLCYHAIESERGLNNSGKLFVKQVLESKGASDGF